MEKKSDDFDDRLDALEQYSRRNCLLIHGVKEDDRENCLKVAEDFFSNKLRVKVNPILLGRAHRIGPHRASNDSSRPIIVRFLSYQERDKVWRVKKNLKSTGFLITESLTATRKKILHEAKNWVGTRNVWTQDGKIVILRENGSRAFISSMRDLQREKGRLN